MESGLLGALFIPFGVNLLIFLFFTVLYSYLKPVASPFRRAQPWVFFALLLSVWSSIFPASRIRDFSMRIERNLISNTIGGLYDLPSGKKDSDKKGKKQRKKQKRAMLKKLYEACIDAFLGPGTIPSPPKIQQLSLILGTHTFFPVIIFFPLWFNLEIRN